MPLDGGTAIVSVIANGSKLASSIAAATKQSQGVVASAGAKLSSVLTNPLVAGGLVITGVVAKMAFDFEDAFTRISAISNASAKDIANWRGEVMDLSGATAQSPKELADALFFLSSAGLESGQVMGALAASAKASAVGLGDTADVANIVASAMNAYAKSGLTAASVTDTLVAAVREGRAEPEEFATALGRILPIAAEAGVSFDQVAASMAGLSNIGLDVNEGTTAMRGALQAIVAPGAQAASAMKDLGLSAQDLLDAIQNEGLIGALTLLKTRAAENSTGQADYLGILRKVIPNVRALTGVLGLSGDALEKNKVLFNAVENSVGSLNKAFGVTEKGPAFQFRKALNDIVIVGTELGTRVLPVVTDLLKLLAPLLKTAAENAQLLLSAFLLYKAVRFLPVLLGAIATGLGAIATAANSVLLAKLAASLGALGLGATKAAAGTATLAYAIGSVSGTAKTVNTDLEAINTAVSVYTGGLAKGTLSQASFATQTKIVEEALGGNAEAFKFAVEHSISYEDALWSLVTPTDELDKHQALLHNSIEKVGQASEKAGKKTQGFAGLVGKALKEFRADTVSAMSAVAGSIADTGAVWTLSANQAVRGAARMAEAQRRLSKDLRELDKLPVGERFKKFLLEQGPQAIDAFIRGNKGQRSAIRNSFKVFDDAMRDTNKAVKAITTKGGEEAGKALPDGAVRGINAGSGALIARAHQLGLDTVQALKDAMGVASPSKEGEKIGRSFIDGLIQGMNQRFGKVSKALEALVPLMQKAIGVGAADQARAFLRELDGLDKRFDKLKTKIGNFRSAIRGAFTDASDLIGSIGAALEQFRSDQEQFLSDQASFLAAQGAGDLGGTAPTAPTSPDLQALVAAQVAQAQQLAKLLKQLQGAGLSTPLLAQLAGQGAGGIATAQALLADPALIQAMNDAQQQIADITQTTVDKLTQAAFGDHVQRLSDQLDKVLTHLQTWFQGLGLTTSELKDAEQDFIQGLRRLNNALEGIGVPGGTPNEGNNRPNITVNVNVGAGADAAQTGRQIRDALLQLQARNGTTGL